MRKNELETVPIILKDPEKRADIKFSYESNNITLKQICKISGYMAR